MIKYNGINYNFDCLIQFQVLQEFLEALAKKQNEYDSILFGINVDPLNINSKEKDINENLNNFNKENYNSSEFKSNDIMEILDLYGLKDGIKKNNELILSLAKRIDILENKTYTITPESIEKSIKTEIVKTFNNHSKENKEKMNDLEKKIEELNKKNKEINNNLDNHLEIIDNDKNELMELIYKNKNEIQKNTEKINNLQKTLNEYINSKISQLKYSINEEINKKLEDYNNQNSKNEKKMTELFNTNINKINEQLKSYEEKIYSLEEAQKKASENFDNHLSMFNTFRSEEKSKNSKIRSEISTLKLMNESFNNNLREINDILKTNTFQNLLSDLNNITNKIVDVEEYKETIDLINLHLKALDSDNSQYRRYFEDIMPLIGKISTMEDLKKLEELLRALLEEQDSNAQKKYADKSEILKNIKNITEQIKLLMSKNENNEKIENCMLASNPLSNYRCASCQSFIGELKNNTQYLPWNKFPNNQDIFLKPYRIGNGFSHFLQNIYLDNSSKNLSNGSDGEKNNILNKANINQNNLSCDKTKNNKNQNALPVVNNSIIRNNKSLNNIIEIKAHFKTEENLSNNYINSYFTKTFYNDNSFIGNKKKITNILTNRKINKNIFGAISNNNSVNNNQAIKEKNNDEKNKKRFLNIKKINNIINIDKDSISPIKMKEQIKKDNYKII